MNRLWPRWALECCCALLILIWPAAGFAVPSITTGSNFTSADAARSNAYMDSGGVWNGTAEVTNTTGDRFQLVLTNTAAGVSPVDDAFDIDLTVTPAAGFRLPSTPNYPVSVNASGGGPACVAPVGVTATQAGGVGTAIAFNFPADTDLPAQNCQFTIEFGLTTSDSAPFVSAGSHTIAYAFTYNETDNDAGSQQTSNENQNVEVRTGDVIVVKAAVPNPAPGSNGEYADGETAQWTVSIFGNGNGGSFATQLTDTLSANFDAATLQLTPPANPPGVPFPVPLGNNQYTVNYISPAQQVDITVEADVAVPSGLTSCPDLRNDASIIDRIGNTSASFDSVQLNLQDPLLDYTPNNITIPFGGTDTVSFNVSNPGIGVNGGTAVDISLTVSGLTGLVVSNVNALWSFDGTDTFTYLGPDLAPGSGDETIANAASVPLSFDLGMSTCGGPTSGTLTWTPSYENICGTSFSPPIRTSTYAVSNSPTLGVAKTTPTTTTNFGQNVSYTIGLTGTDVAGLPVTAGTNNDWVITDTLPAGVGSGTIATVPAGTEISINGGGAITVGPITGLSATDVIEWRGDVSDISPGPLPSITVQFTVDNAGFCPPDPPVTITNTANLTFPSCTAMNGSSAVAFLVNDSPINNATQVFTVNLGGAPFETGRPDRSGGVAADESNEGEHFTFTADYDFPAPYGGVWSGSSFNAEMGSVSLAGNPLELTQGSGPGESSVVVRVENSVGTTVYGPTNLLFADITGGDGSGAMTIPDLNFIGVALTDPSMAGYRLIVTYTVTAPEGALTALSTGLPVGGLNDPNKDNNIGVFTERATISVVGDPNSCASDINFTQGIPGIELIRAAPTIAATINGGNDFDICGPVPAVINVAAPPAGGLSADNVRVFIDGSNYTLPNNSGDITFGGAGNLNAVGKTFDFTGGDVDIEVTNNSDDVAGDSTISFNVQLLNTAQRNLSGTIFYDSNHTSPDFGGEGNDEDYSSAFSITPAAASANLEVEFFPPNIILGDPSTVIPVNQGLFTWQVRITNIGTSTVDNYAFTNLVPAGYVPDQTNSTPNADQVVGQLMIWQTSTGTLPALIPGGSTEVTVAIRLPQGAGCNVGNPNVTTVNFGCNGGAVLYTENGPNIVFPNIDLELAHTSNSFCELCRDGTVELLVRNEGASDLYDVTVVESLAGSGLEYVANSSEVFVEGSGGYVAISDHGSTTSTSITWDQTVINDLGQLYSDLNNVPSEMVIRFRVRAITSGLERDLVGASRNIQASATFDLFCGDPGLPPTTDLFQVPLRQPIPTVIKQGRNYSARQTAANYADTVFGGTDDIVVWRVNITNSGAVSSADLEDLLVSDTIIPPGGPPANLDLQRICPTETDANNAAIALETGGVIPAACVLFTDDFDVDDPFGNPNNDEAGAYIDVASGQTAGVFYVGRIQDQCTNDTNRIDIQWGCEDDPPPALLPAGGIDASTPGTPGGITDDDTASISTDVDPSGVSVTQTVTGTNVAQPVGTKGIITLTAINNSGGTIRDLILFVDLPTGYEIDTTSIDTNPGRPLNLTVTPAFGTYPGMVTDFDDPLTGGGTATQPRFSFDSDDNNTNTTVNQRNLLRNGDQLVLTFNIIRVEDFDNVNNPEVRTEAPGSSTDPNYATSGNSVVTVDFRDTCTGTYDETDLAPINSAVSINPEDLDININPADPNLIFILSDPTATLDFDIIVTNNGGHDANDYDTYVTIGDGMEAITVPGICTGPAAPPATLGAPPAQAGGILPPQFNPADSQTYRCVNNVPLAPGASDTFSFTVQRRLPIGTSGDLTFRADILGETVSTDGVTTPPGGAEPGHPYYSKDNIIARIIGFNLFKRMVGNCTEDNPPPVANDNVIIGEECTYQVEANWFGFATPGFGNIEIRNARIYEGSTTNNPPVAPGDPPTALDGQGFISIDTSASTGAVTVNTQNPAGPAALSETGFMWLLNTVTTTGATQESFFADVVYRSLNDPLNSSAAPNQHDALRTDEVNARFDVFFTGSGATLSFDENSDGYPPASLRTVDVTITEPNIVITKEVCNETRNGGPCAPGDFQASPPGSPVVNGDSDDLYVYRITVENQASGTAVRAPAFDVSITDILDPLDQMVPLPLVSDGLDNDGDGATDEADENIVFDTVPENATPAQIVFASANSTALQRIDEGVGNAVQLFYRAQLEDTVVPTQVIVNTANGVYDTLPGANGSQSAPTGANGTLGGARTYNITQDQAAVEIDDIVINPGSKEFIDTSRRDAGLVAGNCPASPCLDEGVVIGEEVMVELKFTIPVSTLNSFTLVDNLPAGFECIEAFDVTLPAFNPPGVDPGFSVGGTFAATACDQNTVSWDFGNQQLVGTGTNQQLEVSAQFVGRVQNTATNNLNDVIRNGGGSTNVTVTYRDITNALVNIAIDEARLTVQEPIITLSKTMGETNPAPPPLVNALANADAADVVRVEVLLTNTGAATSPIYDNLRIFDDLSAVANLTFLGNLAGPNLPDVVDTATLGANRPIFVFNTGNPIYPLNPGDTVNFSFDILVANGVQPLEVLDNTLSAAWTSLPNNTIALNTSAAIGTDGAANGMRIGAIPNAADPINDYEQQGSQSMTVPSLAITKTDLDPATANITIGERKRYQVVITLPEGTTNNLLISDILDTGDTSFILENDATYDIVYACSDINTVNGTAVGDCSDAALFESALIGGAPADESFGTVTWNLGTVTTLTENDISVVGTRNPSITLTYYARAANNGATFDGEQLGNDGQIDFRHGENGGTVTINDNTALITVVEPDLEVDKTFMGLRPLPPLPPAPPGMVTQGAIAVFDIEVENVGNSAAWDATVIDYLPNLTDPIPPLNNRVAGGFCDAAPVIDFVRIVGGRFLTEGVDFTTTFIPPASVSDLHCQFRLTFITGTLGPTTGGVINNGETLQIRYEVTPDIGTPDSVSLTNVAGATEWFSLDTDGITVSPEIRRYTRALTLPPAANPGTVGTDDHEDAVTVVTQSPILSVQKTVVNLTTGQNPALTASPGDTLRYTITVDNTGPVDGDNIRITDDLDALNIINYGPGYFENAPTGTLNVVTPLPPGAVNASLQSGGSNAAGFVDISNLTAPAGGNVSVSFDVNVEDVDSPLPRAFIENQANVDLPGFNTITSNIAQTEIVNIEAGFLFQKTVEDLSGDPNILALGDTLRYTINIKNIGSTQDPLLGLTHAVNSVLLDQIPANTTYVADSTMLNGNSVADISDGVSALSEGLLVNSPDTTVQGFLTANANMNDSSNVATIRFDVTVNGGLVNSTIISNQAVLTGQQQAVAPFTPIAFNPVFSDDPATADIPNDPTQSIIGNGVNLDVLKTVSVINGGDAVANTGETLRYTIVIANKGNVTATNVRLRDAIPAGVNFVANSVALNGVSQSTTQSELSSGIFINDSVTTQSGQILAGEAAIVTFDVLITATNGNIISNQAFVLSNEQPEEPSDVDGNDENGDQATDIIVGSFADLEISKEVLVVGGGVARASGQLEYLIRIENIGSATASNVIVTDQMPTTTTYVSGSAELNGSTVGTSFSGTTLTANVGSIDAGDNVIVRFRVTIDQPNSNDDRLGEAIENTVTVTANGGINESDTANLDVGGAPGVANINGRVWHNLLHDTVFDSQTEIPLENWRVRIYVNNSNPSASDTAIAEVLTDVDGQYSLNGLAPVDALSAAGSYAVTFSVPDDPANFPAGSNTALGQSVTQLGQTDLMRINQVDIGAGRNAQGENLPVDSTGVVYNSVTREAVMGSRVSLLDINGNLLPESCFLLPAHLDSQQNQITSLLGIYRFDLNFSNSSCPSSANTYVINVETFDDERYERNVSSVIPPDIGPFNVSACPDNTADQVPSPPVDTCEIQAQALPPDPFIPPGNGTRYFLDLSLAQGPERLHNNHIPVDLDVGFLVTISKQTPLKNVVKGQLVPYIITVTNDQEFAISALEVRDFFPPGFKYIEGSGTVDGVQIDPITDATSFFDETLLDDSSGEPLRSGTLTWNNLFIQPQATLTIKLLLIVGTGVGEDEYVNRAQVFITGLGSPISGQASATVRIIPDPTFDCSDIIGKVYDDKNVNGYQDKGELGIAGARVVTAQGLLVTTDQYGRFHIVCASIPNYERGSNFIIKLDERSLPSGYRVITENPRIERLTRGKVTKFNFGATLHRVVRLDLADAAFVKNQVELKEYWKPVYEQLFEQLQQGPSILRLSYMGDAESEKLVNQRLNAIQSDVKRRWKALSCCYNLLIEKEVFWRRKQSSKARDDR